MTTVKVLEDKQTGIGRVVKTERVWETIDGHKVIVKTDALIACMETWAGKQFAFNHSEYICECGRTFNTKTVPSKKVLEQHDAWQTTEQREQIAQTIAAVLNK